LLKAKQTKKEVASAMKDDKSIEEISISLPDIQQYEMTDLTVAKQLLYAIGRTNFVSIQVQPAVWWNLLT